MSRCKATTDLEIHHKRVDGGNDSNNAQVLCHECHVNTSSFGTHGHNPPEFSAKTKQEVLEQSGNRCECIKTGCHD